MARGGRRGWFDQLGAVPTTKELQRLLITGPQPPPPTDPVITIHDGAVIFAILSWGVFVFNEEG